MNLATKKPGMVVSSPVRLACKFGLILGVTTLAVAALCPAARALERVTLTNGQTMDCVGHEQPDSDHILLIYRSDDLSSPNTQLLRSSAIASIDILPDPPKPTPIVATGAAPVSPTDIIGLIARAGAARNIDVDLLYSVIHTESGFRTNAVSRAGARGLMQLMPATARTLGVADPFKADQNIAAGAEYLDQLLTRYHDRVDLALAAYNAGPAAVDRYHGQVPPFTETRAYVARVGAEFANRVKKREAGLAKQAALAQYANQQASTEISASDLSKTAEASR